MKTKLHTLFLLLLCSIGFAGNTTTIYTDCDSKSTDNVTVQASMEDHINRTPALNKVAEGDDCEPECPDDFTVQADMNDQYTIPDYVAEGIVTLTGDCANAVISQTPAPGTVVGLGEIEIEVTATINGDEEDCDFDITVVSGGGDCMINCPTELTVQADANGEYSLPSFFGEGIVTISGDCFAATITQTPPPGTIVTLGQTLITVEVSAGGTTDDCDFTLTVTDVLGVNDETKANIHLYPNPASDVVKISTEVVSATIYDLQGQKLFSTNEATISVASLKTGVYLIRIETETGYTTKQMVIK